MCRRVAGTASPAEVNASASIGANASSQMRTAAPLSAIMRPSESGLAIPERDATPAPARRAPNWAMIVRVVGSPRTATRSPRPTPRACSQRAKPVTACVNAAQVRVASAQARAIFSGALRACPSMISGRKTLGTSKRVALMPPLRPISAPRRVRAARPGRPSCPAFSSPAGACAALAFSPLRARGIRLTAPDKQVNLVRTNWVEGGFRGCHRHRRQPPYRARGPQRPDRDRRAFQVAGPHGAGDA